MARMVLKRDWDVPIRPPLAGREGQGYFAGRSAEVASLANEIVRRRSGAILVSGHCGVGKTSLVYKALQEASAQDDNLIVVLLNAAQLRPDSEDDKITSAGVLENLIRRLYAATREEKLGKGCIEEVEDLYRKAVAKEFHFVEASRRKAEQTEELEREESAEILATEKNVQAMIFVISSIIAAVLLFADVVDPEWNNWIAKLLSLLFAFPVPFGASLVHKKRSRRRQLEEATQTTESLYQMDNSLGNLEFDLESVHGKIVQCKKPKKLVYVVDEMDKLEAEDVTKLLKYLKNLFTLSDALFIFVGGEDLYDLGRSGQVGSYRSNEYTVFTSRYFLSRPLWPELNQYLDAVVEGNELDAVGYEVFKRMICFQARDDFFDLKEYVRDRIMGFSSDGQPIIEFIGFSDRGVQRARFHKVVTVLVENKYMSSCYTHWRENEVLLRRAFEYCQEVFGSYLGVSFGDPGGGDVAHAMIRDLNRFLYRLGAFEITNDPDPATGPTIRGESIPVRTYRYLGSIPVDPPDDAGVPTEFENRFTRRFEEYGEHILALLNAYRSAEKKELVGKEVFWRKPVAFAQQVDTWASNSSNHLSPHHEAYHNIVTRSSEPWHSRESVEQWATLYANYTGTLLGSLHAIVSRMLLAFCPQLELVTGNLRSQGLCFADSARPIRVAGQRQAAHSVVFRKDLSFQLLLVDNSVDVLRKAADAIRDNSSTHRVVCFVREIPEIGAEVEGLHVVPVGTPEVMQASLAKLLGELGAFLQGEVMV